ncbi:hypothetical protein [Streptomyces coeruleorubidus]|uniref:Uncharacterized protein n=1 Tax=Streptomyces coeruleorubidus TaxID=116188 RepID=A0ABZ0K4D6_STRC4|nr:hypothetical protein [Streptomyces coeruleorubidus]WOT32687.1 hypothetical protein R5U08_00275 [Streptomyces coeruleorubidus]
MKMGRRGGVRGMICLESVGYFVDDPGTQRLPAGFERIFPEASAEARAGGYRGDFTLVVHRRSSAGRPRSGSGPPRRRLRRSRLCCCGIRDPMACWAC